MSASTQQATIGPLQLFHFMDRDFEPFDACVGGDCRYEADRGSGIYLVSGARKTKLTTFVAILADENVEGADGPLTIVGRRCGHGGTPMFKVPSRDFPTMDWCEEHFGPGAIMRDSPDVRRHLAGAIPLLSTRFHEIVRIKRGESSA